MPRAARRRPYSWNTYKETWISCLSHKILIPVPRSLKEPEADPWFDRIQDLYWDVPEHQGRAVHKFCLRDCLICYCHWFQFQLQPPVVVHPDATAVVKTQLFWPDIHEVPEPIIRHKSFLWYICQPLGDWAECNKQKRVYPSLTMKHSQVLNVSDIQRMWFLPLRPCHVPAHHKLLLSFQTLTGSALLASPLSNVQIAHLQQKSEKWRKKS